MGGGGRRYRRRRLIAAMARRNARRGTRILRRRCFWRRRIGAASSGDHARLREIAELAAAFVPSRERQLETSTQGRAFIEIARSAWNCEGLGKLISACDGTIVYPVAVGVVSAAHAIPLAPAMHAFFHAVVSNWISAGARLVPLGQTDSQRVLAALEPVVVATAARALERVAGRSRQRHFSRRSRQPAARDAVHAAVQVMMTVSPADHIRAGRPQEASTCPNLTARFGSASVDPSDRARPR